MKLLFLTRCFNINNLQRIKQNIRSVFNNTPHSFQHIILVDLTKNQERTQFQKFQDQLTSVNFVLNKEYRDNYMMKQMDEVIQNKNADYLYVLDDDNLLKDDFLEVVNYCTKQLIVFDSDRLKPRNLNVHHCVGAIDFANYIASLNLVKKIKFYRNGQDSHAGDGIFFLNCLKAGVEPIYVQKQLSYYNIIRKYR